MNKKINIEQCQKDALEKFYNGFTCAESTMFALNKHFDFGFTKDVIAMTCGFPWGLGGAGCICGALASGTMVLGFVFGRREPNDPAINKCFELTNRLHDEFVAEFGYAGCGKLIEGKEKMSQERKDYCAKLVTFMVEHTANIIIEQM